MSTNKHINKICVVIVAIALVLTLLFMYGGLLGITAVTKEMKYESTLFDNSYVHSIDIVMDDWDDFIETCESEEYSVCTAVIDGEKISNIGIRAKGNTSLSTVSSMNSQRYSLKLEFDHYDGTKTYDGLDKLCLNNLIQDNTMMKDYIAYQMMNDFGVDSPLCSFAYVTINGEDWGLFLAVEGIEDGFLSRNYGSEDGDLYKPDSISNGGGRGNGKDFNMDDFDFGDVDFSEIKDQISQSGNFDPTSMSGFDPTSMSEFDPTSMSEFDPTSMSGFDPTSIGGGISFGGMGSDDVKLKYIDENADSYSNIFNNAKTDVSSADEERLIESLKNLNEYTNLEETVDIDEVIRYFVVHNFVCNGDSYTGSMIHNYYLYESDGIMSMIPWDYNLAFGTFQGSNASDTVNTSIDSPISGGTVDDRPMLGWIFSDETYTEKYHELFAEFIEKWFTNGELETMITETAEMIRSYVEKDPTKFCTAEEFETGVTALSEFVSLRAEAVYRQLSGDSTKVDTGSLNLSDMGTMNNGGGNMGGGEMPTMPSGGEMPTMPDGETPTMPDGETPTMPSGDGTTGGAMPTMPSGGEMPSMPSGDETQSTTTETSTDLGKWILIIISVLVLEAGVFIAFKKK